MAYNTVKVTTTATKIVDANSQRQSLIIANDSDVSSVFLGGDSDVTIANGIPLDMGANLTEDSGGTRMYLGPVYGISAVGSIDVRYWERLK